MITTQSKQYTYFVFRIMVGFAFLLHGGQKLFGWFSDNGPVELASQMGAAGIIEFFGGLFIMLGLFVSVTALITALEMAVAYFQAHVPSGSFLPLVNRGEAVWLFFAAFLVLFSYGAGKWGLEKALLKKEIMH